ncbi:hypothetical protein [Peribacillus butanolivorans]|uniref:hypothetical protein n=1 Tax=Peribacillus butanolivorans TaxID=421767 RepID=UPI003673277C
MYKIALLLPFIKVDFNEQWNSSPKQPLFTSTKVEKHFMNVPKFTHTFTNVLNEIPIGGDNIESARL